MTQHEHPTRGRFARLLALVFCSGAAGLAYEISWSRQLGLSLGHTARAAAVVLGAYFIGMALGYAWASGASARWRRPLIGYALAEAVVGAWALVVPVLVGAWDIPLGSSPWQTDVVRAVYGLLVLLPGTTALGASLPFVARAVAGVSPERAGPRIARIYAMNIAGAGVGVAIATYGLLVTLGVAATGIAAGAVSLLVAAVAWRWRGAFVATSPSFVPSRSAAPVPARWVIAAAVSGFGTLAAQVLYMRLFSLVFHNSTYTFASILLVVLGALAAASALTAACIGRVDLERLLRVACWLAAVSLPASALLLLEVRGVDYFSAGSSFIGYVWGSVGLVASVTALPMLAMGMVLPAVWELAGAPRDPGRIVGRLTMVNTLAAAAGAIGASFVLLPLLDLWWSLAFVAVAYLGLASMLARRRWSLAWVGVAAVVVGITTVRLAAFEGVRSGDTLVQRYSGPYGWIDVTKDEDGSSLYLRQNVHYGLGSINSSAMELRQGHLPLLLVDDPREVAFIGLATGTTASAALDHPSVERVTVVELVDEVVMAAEHFAEANAGILDDPRAEVIVGDGRHVLPRLDRRFDVIVSDLFVPWESKTGYLYTVEHFEAMKGSLREGGVFGLWLAGWQVGPGEFELIADSMNAVFDHVSVWVASRWKRRPLFLLVGTSHSHQLSRRRIDERLEHRRPPMVSRDYALRRADDVVELYLGDWPLRPGAPLNTDEHPRVEFFTPRTHRTPKARLKNETYEAYYEHRLATLPRAAFEFDPPAGAHERRRLR